MSLLLASAGTSATVFTYVGDGGLTLGGTAEVATTFTYTASGGIVFAGASEVSITVVPQAAGGTTFGGSAATSYVPAAGAVTFSYEPSGGITFSGNAATEFTPASTGAPSGGGGWITRTVGRLFSRATVVPVARVYQYAPSGGLRLGGAAPTSFTASPRLRREEEELVLLFALLG